VRFALISIEMGKLIMKKFVDLAALNDCITTAVLP
jgi:hypothetical protein